MATVPVIAPNGTPGDIPEERLSDALKAGYQKAVSVKNPDGQDGLIPETKLQAALAHGYTQSVVAPPAPPSRDYNATGQEPPSPYQPSPRSNLEAVEGTEPAPSPTPLPPGVSGKPGIGLQPTLDEGPETTTAEAWKGFIDPVKAAAMAAAGTYTLGGSTGLLTAANELGPVHAPHNLENLATENPIATGIGSIGGAFLPGPGTPGMILKAGKWVKRGIEDALHLETAAPGLSTIIKKAIASGAGSAIETAAWGAGQQVHESALGDPNQTAESALASLKWSSALGLGLGAAGSVGDSFLSKVLRQQGVGGAEPRDLADKLRVWAGLQDVAGTGAAKEARETAALIAKEHSIKAGELEKATWEMPFEELPDSYQNLTHDALADIGKQLRKPVPALENKPLLGLFDTPDKLVENAQKLRKVSEESLTHMAGLADQELVKRGITEAPLPNLGYAIVNLDKEYVQPLLKQGASAQAAQELQAFIVQQSILLKQEAMTRLGYDVVPDFESQARQSLLSSDNVTPIRKISPDKANELIANNAETRRTDWEQERALALNGRNPEGGFVSDQATFSTAYQIIKDTEAKINEVMAQPATPVRQEMLAALYHFKRDIHAEVSNKLQRLDYETGAKEGFRRLNLKDTWMKDATSSELADISELLGKSGVSRIPNRGIGDIALKAGAAATLGHFIAPDSLTLELLMGAGGLGLATTEDIAKTAIARAAAPLVERTGKMMQTDVGKYVIKGSKAALQEEATRLIRNQVEKSKAQPVSAEKKMADGGIVDARIDFKGPKRRQQTDPNAPDPNIMMRKLGIEHLSDSDPYRTRLPKGLPIEDDDIVAAQKQQHDMHGYIKMADGGEVPTASSNPSAIPTEKIAVLAALERNNNKVANTIRNGASTLVRSGVKASSKSRNEALPGLHKNLGTSDLAAHEKHAADLQTLQNPEIMAQRMANMTADLEQHAPQTAMAARIATTKASNFLYSKLPQPPNKSPLGADWHPSASELATYNKYKNAVDDPISLLKMAASGTITPHAVEAVQTVYPALFDSMKTAITDKLSETKRPSYQARQAIGNLFGMDMDGSHANVMTLQQTYQSPSAKSADSQAMPAKNTAQMAKVDLGARAEPLSAQRDEA